MRRFAHATALAAALAFAALATDAPARGGWASVSASVAYAGDSAARGPQAVSSSANNGGGGGGQSNVERYVSPARRARRVATALACAAAAALLLIAFAIWKRIRPRARGLT
jgi:hypothetical protein